jgi:hypothetical protein
MYWCEAWRNGVSDVPGLAGLLGGTICIELWGVR